MTARHRHMQPGLNTAFGPRTPPSEPVRIITHLSCTKDNQMTDYQFTVPVEVKLELSPAQIALAMLKLPPHAMAEAFKTLAKEWADGFPNTGKYSGKPEQQQLVANEVRVYFGEQARCDFMKMAETLCKFDPQEKPNAYQD